MTPPKPGVYLHLESGELVVIDDGTCMAYWLIWNKHFHTNPGYVLPEYFRDKKKYKWLSDL